MSWTEIIKIETAGRQGEEGCRNYLKNLKQERLPGAPDQEITIYAHAVVSGQYMVRLEWYTSHPETSASELSKELIYELKRFGLVDHSIWITSEEETESSAPLSQYDR